MQSEELIDGEYQPGKDRAKVDDFVVIAILLRCSTKAELGSQISKLAVDRNRTLDSITQLRTRQGQDVFSRFIYPRTFILIAESYCIMAKTCALQWQKIPVSLAELCLDTTLRCGQSFRYVVQLAFPSRY